MINVSEHVQRPQDMLMFLGEYFKALIHMTGKINENLSEKKQNGRQALDQFYLTNDILSQLGTACKLYIEKLRQELRITIALIRNPSFQQPETVKSLHENI